MPKVIKKKPAKKKPVQETEEVKSAALHALDAIRARQKQMLVIVSAIAAIAIIIIVFILYSSSQDKKAHDLEIEANSIYYSAGSDNIIAGTEKWKRALELYKKAVDIKASPSALLSLGNCYYNLGDYENAIKQYNTFTDKFGNDDVISPIIYQKLASAYFNTGKSDKALEALANLSSIKNGAFRDTALTMEARYYDAMGDTAKAKEKYMALVSEYPNSPWRAEAAAKVSLNTNNNAQKIEQIPSAADPAKK